jgi:beta-N-acetylhexosaminidase
MHAVSQRYTIEEMIELGLEAGIDIFLICHTESLWQRAWKHLVYLGQQNQEKRDTIISVAERIHALKRQHFVDSASDKDPLATLGCPEHRALFSMIDKEATNTPAPDPTEATN